MQNFGYYINNRYLASKQIHYGKDRKKLRKKNNPFGGINFVLQTIDYKETSQLIDNKPGTRPQQAKYSYSDLLKNLWSVIFCGGEVAEDINNHLKVFFRKCPQ